MTGERNWYKVHELIAKLRRMPPDANVLLMDGIWEERAANEDDFGIPAGLQSLGLNSVIQYGDSDVYLLHSTVPAPPTQPSA